MEKITRKSFAAAFQLLQPMEKMNILLELYEQLTQKCRQKSDFTPLKLFLNKYIRHKVKYLSAI